MSLVIDAGPLIVLADPRDLRRRTVERILSDEPGHIAIPAQVTAEADYLLRRQLHRAAASAFLSELAAGRLEVMCLTAAEYQLAEL